MARRPLRPLAGLAPQGRTRRNVVLFLGADPRGHPGEWDARIRYVQNELDEIEGEMMEINSHEARLRLARIAEEIRGNIEQLKRMAEEDAAKVAERKKRERPVAKKIVKSPRQVKRKAKKLER